MSVGRFPTKRRQRCVYVFSPGLRKLLMSMVKPTSSSAWSSGGAGGAGSPDSASAMAAAGSFSPAADSRARRRAGFFSMRTCFRFPLSIMAVSSLRRQSRATAASLGALCGRNEGGERGKRRGRPASSPACGDSLLRQPHVQNGAAPSRSQKRRRPRA
uniref:Uncharacterized protein n=1 Tax=Equus asinus TaxID=9793 RepID=A0A9L0JYJ9_EQUAS